jgi:hypothetical protein
MKRLLLLIILGMFVYWIVASHRSKPRWAFEPPQHWNKPRHGHEGKPGRPVADEARQEARRAFAEARAEVRQAFAEARDEIRQAFDEARGEVQQAFAEAREALVASDEQPAHSSPAPPTPPPARQEAKGHHAERDDCGGPAPAREEAEGLPVPIVPGTRVTEAQERPPAPVPPLIAIRHQVPPRAPAPARLATAARAPSPTRLVTGLISATEERAKAEARHKLQAEVVAWLDPEVPGSWTPPARTLDAMVVETRIDPVVKDYGTLYVAQLKVDASRERRAALVEVYHRELVGRRLATLGGTLAFILICLGAVSGYIRADEVTKGYYTNRLRMLAAAGIGAAGVIIYQMVS